jgi:hypothetical protein
MEHGECAKPGRTERVAEFSQRISAAITGVSLMIHWIDDVRRELRYADELGNAMAERELIRAFVENSGHFVGYSEAMLREMRDATEELIARHQAPGETIEP